MIPKIIHYCWFGRNPMPELALKCIESWKKKCPDYTFMEWNEDTFDFLSAPLYVRQAYESKKWAFVTDYVRLWAMVKYGGIYMDTDVEVKKSLDKFLKHEAVSGFESETDIPTGLMGCRKGFPLFEEFLRYYDDASFYNSDGSMNLTTNVVIMTNICLKYGLQQNNKFQVINGFAIYPKDVFCPINNSDGEMRKTFRTATIHWFAGSWIPEKERTSREAYISRVRRAKRKDRLDTIKHTPNRIAIKILGKNRYEKLKTMIRRK